MASHRTLFLSEHLSDMSVKVRGVEGYLWRYPAHSLILRAGSEWFNERIEEQRQISSDDICITFVDIHPNTVLHLLRFLYTKELASVLREKELLDLLGASIRCKVWQLEIECETKLLRIIRVGNAVRILKEATGMLHSGHGSRVVVESCRKVILDFGQIIFLSDLLLQLDRRNLEQILQSDSLNVAEEDVVFYGLWRWGKRHCSAADQQLTDKNIAEILNGLLNNIRFSLITNPTVIPLVVTQRYCKCKKSSSCCCFAEIPTEKCRTKYHQPRDLLRLSCRLVLFEALQPWHSVSSIVERLLCLQLSFEEDVFLVAVEIAALTSSADMIHFTITSEDTSVELIREEVSWTKIKQDVGSEDQKLRSSVVRLAFPVPMPRKVIHSFHLLLPSGLDFPTRAVLERKNVVITDHGPLQLNLHTDRITAVTSVYFIVAETTGY